MKVEQVCFGTILLDYSEYSVGEGEVLLLGGTKKDEQEKKLGGDL